MLQCVPSRWKFRPTASLLVCALAVGLNSQKHSAEVKQSS
jgi:hypothetical protein